MRSAQHREQFSIQRFTQTILLSLYGVFKNSNASTKYSIASHFSSQIRSVIGITGTAGRQLEGKTKGQPEDLISFSGNNKALACPLWRNMVLLWSELIGI